MEFCLINKNEINHGNQDINCKNDYSREKTNYHEESSIIRMETGNSHAKIIDYFINYVNEDDDNNNNNLSVEIQEPSTYLNGLIIPDLEKLLRDIHLHTQLAEEKSRNDSQYWQDIITITKHELDTLRKLSSKLCNNRNIDDKQELIHPIVHQDPINSFYNKKNKKNWNN